MCGFSVQVVLGLVYYFEKFMGFRSSGINFLYWLAMLGYGTVKIRSLSLIAVDRGEVRTEGRGGEKGRTAVVALSATHVLLLILFSCSTGADFV